MSKVREIYHAIGFLPKKDPNRLAQIGVRPAFPFVESTEIVIDSLAYMESLTAQRKDYLKITTAGPEGTVYHASVNDFAGLLRVWRSIPNHSSRQICMMLWTSLTFMYLSMSPARSMVL